MAKGRRVPRQERSQKMVERILDAAARVLVESGYQAASTNRIAREAAVSPGSVYQYFADKDAIVGAISRRIVEEFTTAMGPVLRESAAAPPGLAVPTVLDGALAALHRQGALLRALVDHVPAAEQRRNLAAVRERLGDRVHLALAAGARDLRGADVDRRTWLIVELSQGLLVRYVLDAPPIAREDFLADLTAIVLRLAEPSR
jgi:AcrR family transcriptional regulator